MSRESAVASRMGGSGPFSSFEFMLAFRYLRARRKEGGVTVIAVISFVGIAIAVAALIAVMSVMNGFRHELLTRLLGVQPHILVYAPVNESSELSNLADQIRELQDVRQAGPVSVGQGLITTRRGSAFAQVSGVRGDDLRRWDLITGDNGAREARGGIASGNAETFGIGRNGGNEIVIGSAMAARLGVMAGDEVTLVAPRGAATPLGVTHRSKTYVVAAVITVGVQDLDQILAYLPIEQASIFFNRPAGGDFIDVRVENPDAPDTVTEAIRRIAPEGTVVVDWRGENEAFWNALQVERVAMRLILSIVILIAALNIISGIVMLVKNKTRDIAILRTMGASQGAIMRVFLISGATIGVLGTIAGIILGLLFVTFIGQIADFISWVSGVNVFDPSVYSLYRIPARLDWGEVIFVSGWGFVMSLLATLWPSMRAGRMDPVEALRNE